MDKITIIVPVYNVELYLRKCVDSLLNQTHTNLEIILVDDGSTDSSGKICDEYLQKDSRIRVIHKTNGGLSDARNTGIEAATGSYIGFVDSDDWIEKEMYASLYGKMVETQTTMCVCGRYDWVGARKYKGLCPSTESVYTAQEFLRRLFRGIGLEVTACDKLYHRSLFDDIRYPVGEIHEDVAVIHYLIKKAGKISTVKHRYYNYNHRESSIMTSAFSEKELVVLEYERDIVRFTQENYSDIMSDAKAYYGRHLLGFCLSVPQTGEYTPLHESLSQELTSLYSDLYFIDKIKYILIRYRVYYLVRKIVKGILRKY